MNILSLEAVQDGPLVIKLHGHRITVPMPVELTVYEIMDAYRSQGASLFDPQQPGMTNEIAAQAFELWKARHDFFADEHGLSEFLWFVDTYGDAVELDLRNVAHLSLVEHWKARNWRHLAALLNAMPLASHTKAAMHTDPKYAELVAKQVAARKAQAGKQPEEPGGPSLLDWTLETELLTKALDELRALRTTLIAVNSTAGKQPSAPKPEPRPRTAHQDVKETSRMIGHRALASRLMPGRSTPPTD